MIFRSAMLKFGAGLFYLLMLRRNKKGSANYANKRQLYTIIRDNLRSFADNA
jgi:hypothetical protein